MPVVTTPGFVVSPACIVKTLPVISATFGVETTLKAPTVNGVITFPFTLTVGALISISTGSEMIGASI